MKDRNPGLVNAVKVARRKVYAGMEKLIKVYEEEERKNKNNKRKILL